MKHTKQSLAELADRIETLQVTKFCDKCVCMGPVCDDCQYALSMNEPTVFMSQSDFFDYCETEGAYLND